MTLQPGGQPSGCRSFDAGKRQVRCQGPVFEFKVEQTQLLAYERCQMLERFAGGNRCPNDGGARAMRKHAYSSRLPDEAVLLQSRGRHNLSDVCELVLFDLTEELYGDVQIFPS